MKRITLSLFAILTVYGLFAQKADFYPKKSQYSINLGLASIDLAGEFRLAERFSLYNTVGFGAAVFNNLNQQHYWKQVPTSYKADVLLPVFSFAPYISMEGRYYYGLKKSQNKKATFVNTRGFYAAIVAKAYNGSSFVMGDKDYFAQSFRLGATTGFQATISKKLLINGFIGLSRNFNKDFSYASWFPTLNTKIGYVLK